MSFLYMIDYGLRISTMQTFEIKGLIKILRKKMVVILISVLSPKVTFSRISTVTSNLQLNGSSFAPRGLIKTTKSIMKPLFK